MQQEMNAGKIVKMDEALFLDLAVAVRYKILYME